MSIHTIEAVEKARARIAEAVKAAGEDITTFDGSRVHVGQANSKTNAINEGTSPLLTCSAHACETCGRECYAVWHIDNVYPAARRNHAENTILRRKNAREYYTVFFGRAYFEGRAVVRVNETGDFENADQLRALCAVARKFKTVQVIGYTRRPELAAMLCKLPKNVHIRYSLYRDDDAAAPVPAARRRVPCCRVSDSETTCPAQIAAQNGRPWSCAMCAMAGAGCCGSSPVVVFKAH